MRQTSKQYDERTRRVAQVMWDVLSDLGYEDATNSAEHAAAFASDERIEDLARAAYIVVGRVVCVEGRP